MDFLMATAIHPLFKLPVVRLLNPEKVYAMKSRLMFEVTEQAVMDTSESSNLDQDQEDDFFKKSRTNSYKGHELYPPLQQDGERASELGFKEANKLLEQAMFPALSRAAWVDVFMSDLR
ncbi:hypothetical protein GWK47_035691 [Chionoecetes opilio]|uniref:Uncharacterized protein n=1 Tax=Chionoecetes opilio TaxID=41210 RepID=A0A8J5CZB0_CHIOP|nr:hypothetical protein GWK47_035691 [Chionoecetes opilio]